MYTDPEGTSFFQYLWSRIVNWFNELFENIKTFPVQLKESITAIASNFSFEAGVGTGFGFEFKNKHVGVSLVAGGNLVDFYYTKDMNNLMLGKRGFVNASIGIKDIFSIGYTPIDEFDPYFSEKSYTTNGVNVSLSFSGSLYVGIGASVSIGIDLIGLYLDLRKIWG